jgi:hypothetical protein
MTAPPEDDRVRFESLRRIQHGCNRGGIDNCHISLWPAARECSSGTCGDDLGGKIIGTDTLRRSGDTLYISHKVSGADPGKHYYLSLWDGTSPGCITLIADLGKFKVDSNGSGSKNATADVSGTAGIFLVCDYNNDTATYDCSTPLVQLGPDES